ncbi:Rim21 protein [Candida orthopsilosis Co 90-125]|uniref:pH-response regulator protein palH/RIM21 n=1 Tax=Candida orthopsilosis (strain 90-125) TaxID=1136231 RepID=H8X841_CANO9|nr:Rim21 protein [Candida orthopsilosis Co 90-125]CCG24140.1 Rim21 protein [Candida orthopsilosis Co 90-125]
MKRKKKKTDRIYKKQPIINEFTSTSVLNPAHAMYWKNTWWEGKPYPSCEEIKLNEGMIISHNQNYPVQYISKAHYVQNCYRDSIPVLNTNVGLVIDKFTKPLPIVAESWANFTHHNTRGSFSYSVVSIVYAIAVSAVITWFLTIFVFTNYTIKPSWLLKLSTLLSSVYILVVVIKSIIILHSQQREGYLHGAKVLNEINENKAVNIIDLIVVLLLQINQVQIIMRLFQRQKDKRLTFYVGCAASLTSQVIWGISQFHYFDVNNEAGDILPAFIYLVRIAMALCYAAIITVYFISKIQIIIANRRIWLLTLLTLILIYSPVAFFIADVSNAFIYELSEIFSVVNYVIGVVIPWEWCNKFNLIMRAKEKEGVLGRRFYEDESYELDRFELFVEEQMPEEEDGDEDDPGSSNPNDVEATQDRRDLNSSGTTSIHVSSDIEAKEFSAAKKVLHALQASKKAFLTLTDNIIAAGFAIPRSVSVSTHSFTGRSKDPHNVDLDEEIDARVHSNVARGRSSVDRTAREGPPEFNTASSTTSRNRRNVYVYAKKEVVVDLSSQEEER